MATIPVRATPIGDLSRAARRSYRIVAEIPSLPLLMLSLLAFAAVFAPVIAPHGKLDPVKPTPAQCQARYGLATCPYVDNVPPF